MSTLGAVTDEVAAVHRFLADWITGAVPASDAAFAEGLADRLHPRFEIVHPSGRIQHRDDLLGELRAAWGANPAFTIAVRNVRLLEAWPASGLLLTRYVEHQGGARRTAPAENDRLSTVLFERGVERLLWRYLHETALPRG